MATAEESRQALRARIAERLGDGPGAAWLAEHGAVYDVDAVLKLMPEAGRVFGKKPLVAAFAERDRAAIEGVWGPLRVGDWRLDDAVRLLIVARCADATESPYDTLWALYDRGDTETRAAAIRALNFVRAGDPESGLRLVHDGGRTYLDELIKAAWCDNPFASRHLSEQEFRKAVLKAFFVGAPVDRILDLERRADAELAKSLCDYIDERLAAGRPVPPLLWSVAALHPRPGLVARLIGNLEHPNRDERLAAARALANARDARALSFISERLEREPDADVRAALEAARTPSEKA
jgi:hypothetical protein